MGAVKDRSGITLADVKTRLGVSGIDFDGVLTEMLEAALEEADNFLNNPFWAPLPYPYFYPFGWRFYYPYPPELPPAVELAIPSAVKRGVHALIKTWWEMEQGGMDGLASSVKEGDVQINYLSAADRVAAVQTQFWASWRLEPGL